MIWEWTLALASIAGLAVNVLMQIAFFRCFPRVGLLVSVYFGFFVGLIVTATLSLFCFEHIPLPILEMAGLTATNMLSFVALGYGYFHFLNLGETARRVRILWEFSEADRSLTSQEIHERYNAWNIVKIRLARMRMTKQVRVVDGKYFIANPTLLLMARILVALKILILGRKSEMDRPDGN